MGGVKVGGVAQRETLEVSELRRYLRVGMRKAGEEGSRAARLCTAGWRSGHPTCRTYNVTCYLLAAFSRELSFVGWEAHPGPRTAASCLLFTDLLAGCANICYP